jgi:uncharacterized protein (DUF1015 family)
MSVLHPFRALRPTPAAAADVVCPPYDVISVREARALAQGRPDCFLRVVRPEVDLPEGIDEHDDQVYATGAANLDALRRSPRFERDDAPALYVQQLIMGDHTQTGIFGCVSVDEYDQGLIVRHENTRQDKEDDRTRHIVEQRAHAEPVLLAFPDDDAVLAHMDAATQGPPLIEVTVQGVTHRLWKIDAPQALVDAFAAVPRLYIADGHHRCKASSRTAAALRGTPAWTDEVAFFPAVIFPLSQLRILPYHRLLRSLPGSRAEFARAVDARLGGLVWNPPPVPLHPGQVSFYMGGELGWHGATLPPTTRDLVSDTLDVARLAEHVFEGLLGITDPRTDARLAFVGGIRGPAALEEAVDHGEAEVGIAMHPTRIEDWIAVSDAGLLMPPKSTWFEPKLISGLLIHDWDDGTPAPAAKKAAPGKAPARKAPAKKAPAEASVPEAPPAPAPRKAAPKKAPAAAAAADTPSPPARRGGKKA